MLGYRRFTQLPVNSDSPRQTFIPDLFRLPVKSYALAGGLANAELLAQELKYNEAYEALRK